MRRFFAYIIMMVTMIAALAFNTQAVLETKNDAMEYGTGTELVYSLTDRSPSNYPDEVIKEMEAKGAITLDSTDIESKVMKRLDAAGVRNADVSIVQGRKAHEEDATYTGYELRVSISPLSETELNNVKMILNYTGSLAIATAGDTYVVYEEANEFFVTDGDCATLLYNGTTPLPALKVKSSEAFDKLKSKAEETNQNKAAETEEGEEAPATEAYLWMNKTLEDTYDKAYGTNETIVQQAVKDKVIAKLDLNNFNAENLMITIPSDLEGNAFTTSTARAFVSMLNCEDYGFDIEFLYQNRATATFGRNAINLTYIIFGIFLVVICAIMIGVYGMAGVTSSVTMLGSVLISFFLFSILGFEFSIAALCGLAAILALSVIISVNYFERVKAELRNGRDIEKANKEGYHKSFLTTVDVSAITLITSIFSFLVSTGSFRTFFGVIMIGTIFTFLLTNYINKWMMYWLIKDTNKPDLPYFSFRKVTKKEEKNIQFASADKKHFSKKLTWIIPAACALVFGISMPVSYLLSGNHRSFFNNSGDFANTYRLNITFEERSQSYEPLALSSNYLLYLEGIGEDSGAYTAYADSKNNNAMGANEFTYFSETAAVNIVEKKDEEDNTYFIHYFSVKVNRDLNDVKSKVSSDNTIIQVIESYMSNDENIEISSTPTPINPSADSYFKDDSLVVNSYVVTPTNVAHTSNYLILVGFLISAFAFVYILLRNGLNVSLAGLATGTAATALYLGLLALLRIPYTSYTGFAVLIAVTILNLLIVPVLARNKEVLRERGIRNTATEEERATIASENGKRALYMVLPVLVITLVFGLTMCFINPALVGLGIATMAFAALDFVFLYFFSIPFYHFLATHISFAKANEWLKKKNEKKQAQKEAEKEKIIAEGNADGIVYVDDGPHETIIVGMNDFRNKD